MPLTDSILNLANTTIVITHRTGVPAPAWEDSAPTTVVVSREGQRPAHERPGPSRGSRRARGRRTPISVWTLEPLQLGDIARASPAGPHPVPGQHLRGQARRAVGQPPGCDLLLRDRPKGRVLVPANWQAVQDAIFAWAVASLGLPVGQGDLAGPGRVRPERRLHHPVDPRSDTVEGPVRHERTDPAKPPGQEVIPYGRRDPQRAGRGAGAHQRHRRNGYRRARHGGADADLVPPSRRSETSSSARGSRPTTRVACNRSGQVRAANFVGRAVYAYRAYLADLVENAGTYIQTVQATGSGIVVDVVTLRKGHHRWHLSATSSSSTSRPVGGLTQQASVRP